MRLVTWALDNVVGTLCTVTAGPDRRVYRNHVQHFNVGCHAAVMSDVSSCSSNYIFVIPKVEDNGPLLQLLWGNESSPTAAVFKVTGLPPVDIFHADNLENFPPFEGKRCVSARHGRISVGIVVEESSHKRLKQNTKNSDVNFLYLHICFSWSRAAPSSRTQCHFWEMTTITENTLS